jgi:hypothetical protein
MVVSRHPLVGDFEAGVALGEISSSVDADGYIVAAESVTKGDRSESDVRFPLLLA